jgi:hypothetical protein
MKRFTLFFAIIMIAVVCYGQSIYKPIAPLYPGSVQTGSSEGYFLSKDSYEKVKTFYLKDKGQPKSEITGEAKDKHAFYVYYTSPECPKMGSFDLGVNISTNSGNERAIEYVFERFQEGVFKQMITQREYDDIVKKYGYLKNLYYQYDANVRNTSAMAIYKKYDKMIKDNIEGQGQNLEEMSMQVQRLMAEGKMQEVAELMKQMQSATGALATDMTSGDEYELWKKCIEEIEKNAYTTQIRIDDSSNI